MESLYCTLETNNVVCQLYLNKKNYTKKNLWLVKESTVWEIFLTQSAGIAVKNLGCRGMYIWLSILALPHPSCWFWVRHLTPLNLSLRICTMGEITVPILKLLWGFSEIICIKHSSLPDTYMVIIIVIIIIRDLMEVYQNPACPRDPFTRSQRCPKIHQKACCGNVNRKDWDTFENILWKHWSF